jgi:hypothetical protein
MRLKECGLAGFFLAGTAINFREGYLIFFKLSKKSALVES